MNIKVLDTSGKSVSSLKVSDEIFAAEYNEGLIHQVVVAQLANARQGTKSTLTRSEVRGHAKKPYRQKGTGNARHGDTKSPQYRGGGVVFAPKPRDYSKKVNKEAKKAAFRSAISAKFADGNVIVLDKLALSEPKTKEMVQILENLKLDKTVLIVNAAKDDVIKKASNNLSKVEVTTAKLLNVYDVVSKAKVVLTVDAVKLIEEAYAK